MTRKRSENNQQGERSWEEKFITREEGRMYAKVEVAPKPLSSR
jgi:hypothetical protein